MKFIVIESNPDNKTKKDVTLSPCTSVRDMYNSRGIIQYLTRNKIVPNNIIHTIHCNAVKTDGM